MSRVSIDLDVLSMQCNVVSLANRAESIKMLVALARDKSVSTRQYIFLTPHDLGMLQDADDLKILEMEHL